MLLMFNNMMCCWKAYSDSDHDYYVCHWYFHIRNIMIDEIDYVELCENMFNVVL